MTPEQEQYIKDNCNPVDIDESYDDMLDECYTTNIAGIEYSTSRALKEVDPTAYRCGKVDYEDSLGLIEIDGDYYDPNDVDQALEDWAAEQDEDEEEKDI